MKEKSLKIAIVTDGTWGDVLPFIFIGRELVERGHRIKIFCNEEYAEVCNSFGLNHIQTTSKKSRQNFLSDKRLWTPRKSFKTVIEAADHIFDESFDKIKKKTKSADVIISHTLTYSAKTTAQINKIPYISMLIAPIQAQSTKRLPTFFGDFNCDVLPSFIKKYFYKVGNWFILDRFFNHFAKNIVRTRKKHNLSPIKDFIHWANSENLSIGLWADWYCDVQKDQKSYLKLAGFTHQVEMGDNDKEISEWMQGGDVIVITMGSGFNFIQKWQEIINEITANGFKCVILGPKPNSFKDSENIKYRQRLKLSQILPNAKLFIHHGGAGMVNQSIYAGVPSLVVPMTHDQPDNAHLMKINGLAKVIWMKKPSIKKVLYAIENLLQEDQINHMKRVLENRSQQTKEDLDGIKAAADLVENHLK